MAKAVIRSKSVFLAMALVIQFVGLNAFAETEATKPLYRQLDLLKQVQPYVERIDLARLFVIQTSVTSVIKNMESNVAAKKNEVTMETMRLIQGLIIQYRFSQVFFGWTEPKAITSIYAPVIEPQLNEIHSLSQKMVVDYGMDDSPYTQITANTFTQMQKILKQLETLPIDGDLKSELRKLWPSIGETIAIAGQGDRPRTFEKAIVSIGLIRNLYPQFNRIANSDAGFPMIMELQGLAEFYAEFAQME
jgi:hypothetical protein